MSDGFHVPDKQDPRAHVEMYSPQQVAFTSAVKNL